MLAKSGDKMTAKAGAALCRAGLRLTEELTVVQPKAPGEKGQWVCIDCGALPENNMQAHSHTKSHRLAWRSFDSGNIEAPE